MYFSVRSLPLPSEFDVEHVELLLEHLAILDGLFELGLGGGNGQVILMLEDPELLLDGGPLLEVIFQR